MSLKVTEDNALPSDSAGRFRAPRGGEGDGPPEAPGPCGDRWRRRRECAGAPWREGWAMALCAGERLARGENVGGKRCGTVVRAER